MEAAWTIVLLFAASSVAMLWYAKRVVPSRTEARIEESARAFSKALELRFPVQKGVTARVCNLCMRLAHELGMPPERTTGLRLAAELRDIGLCAVPHRVLNEKPVSEWTQSERRLYHRHPELGASMLAHLPALKHIAGIVRCHHAPFGEGADPTFPSGKALPIESRILKVASEYAWFERCEGKEIALAAIENGAGTKYDPALVSGLRRVLTSERDGERAPA
jgi:response regulator RpfG family c-di-GMP phosphodiesterase